MQVTITITIIYSLSLSTQTCVRVNRVATSILYVRCNYRHKHVLTQTVGQHPFSMRCNYRHKPAFVVTVRQHLYIFCMRVLSARDCVRVTCLMTARLCIGSII